MRLIPILILLSALTAPLHAAVEQINGIAAVVNNDVITWNELDRRVDTISQQLRQRGNQLPPQEALQKQVLERLIMEKLQLERARQLGIDVKDEQLNRIIDNIARENGMSLTQFRRALKADGVSFAFFREQIRDEVRISRLKSNQVDNRVNVTPQEVDAFLEKRKGQSDQDTEYRLRHILVALSGNAGPDEVQQARARAEQLLEQLEQGESFSQVAIAHSDGQQALEGGDLGWRRIGQLPTLFADEISAMEPGEISPIIRSSSGFHILQLEEKRGEERSIIRQVNARHILIKTGELVSEREARERLQRLRERIIGGESFADLARANSEDPGSAAKGGELGWSDPSIYVQAFQEAL
ncbi:MAG: peptidylprolyl isomerase, partial [Pseudomonadota bacterium]